MAYWTRAQFNKHRNRELERLHAKCRQAAVDEAEDERQRQEDAAKWLRPATEEHRPRWRV